MANTRMLIVCNPSRRDRTIRDFSKCISILGLTTLVVVLAPARILADIISVVPNATYLLTSNDPVFLSPAIIELNRLSFPVNAGTTLVLERLGEFSAVFNPSVDNQTSMIGVFSSSEALLTLNVLNRVVGAIDAGVDHVTPPTFFGGLATDIAEDFLISGGQGAPSSVVINVPAGAQYLFVCSEDSLFFDNNDPNGNYAIRITAVPEPSSLALIGLCAVGAGAMRFRRLEH